MSKISFPAGVTFPMNNPVAKPRDIPNGSIKSYDFSVEKNAAGEFVFAIRVVIPTGVVHNTAFDVEDTDFEAMGFFPLSDITHGVLNISNVSHAFAQTGSKVAVNMNFEVANSKIGGAGPR